MPEAATKLPQKRELKSEVPASGQRLWEPIESLRREVDRLFDEFEPGLWARPFRRPLFGYPRFFFKPAESPAVDATERDKAFEITAELPGIDEKDVEVKLSDGGLTIRGEKKEEKEEKKKDYYVSERRYGSFKRYFALPEGVEAAKISATFKHGVLTVTLPKTPEAQKSEKTIDVKAG